MRIVARRESRKCRAKDSKRRTRTCTPAPKESNVSWRSPRRSKTRPRFRLERLVVGLARGPRGSQTSRLRPRFVSRASYASDEVGVRASASEFAARGPANVTPRVRVLSALLPSNNRVADTLSAVVGDAALFCQDPLRHLRGNGSLVRRVLALLFLCRSTDRFEFTLELENR